MFRTITARYAGQCKRCRKSFGAGERIRFGGYGRTYHLSAQCPAAAAAQLPTNPGTIYTDDVLEAEIVPSPRPIPGSQEWAETRADDVPCLDQPGDDFDVDSAF